MKNQAVDRASFGAGLIFAGLLCWWILARYVDIHPLLALAGVMGIIGVALGISALFRRTSADDDDAAVTTDAEPPPREDVS